MSRTKELFIAGFFLALGFLVTWNIAHSQEQLKCYPNAEFMKVIDEKALVTLYNGVIGNKMHEVMMTKDRHMYR